MTRSEVLPPCAAKAPEQFLCPLTMEVMQHPVSDRRTGVTYERRTIMEWIYFGKPICPVTRKHLNPRDLDLNVELQSKIAEWKKEHGFPELDDAKSKRYNDAMDESETMNGSEEPEESLQLDHIRRRASVTRRADEPIELSEMEMSVMQDYI